MDIKNPEFNQNTKTLALEKKKRKLYKLSKKKKKGGLRLKTSAKSLISFSCYKKIDLS